MLTIFVQITLPTLIFICLQIYLLCWGFEVNLIVNALYEALVGGIDRHGRPVIIGHCKRVPQGALTGITYLLFNYQALLLPVQSPAVRGYS